MERGGDATFPRPLVNEQSPPAKITLPPRAAGSLAGRPVRCSLGGCKIGGGRSAACGHPLPSHRSRCRASTTHRWSGGPRIPDPRRKSAHGMVRLERASRPRGRLPLRQAWPGREPCVEWTQGTPFPRTPLLAGCACPTPADFRSVVRHLKRESWELEVAQVEPVSELRAKPPTRAATPASEAPTRSPSPVKRAVSEEPILFMPLARPVRDQHCPPRGNC